MDRNKGFDHCEINARSIKLDDHPLRLFHATRSCVYRHAGMFLTCSKMVVAGGHRHDFDIMT